MGRLISPALPRVSTGLITAAFLAAIVPAWAAAGAQNSKAKTPEVPAASTQSGPSTAAPSDLSTHWKNARLAAASGEFAVAESELRAAIALQPASANGSETAATALQMDLATILANRGQLDEAGLILRRISPVVAQSARVGDKARLAGYLAQLALRRGDGETATAEAAASVQQWRSLAQTSSTRPRGGVADASTSTYGVVAELAMALNLEANAALYSGDASSAAVKASEALLLLEQAPSAPAWWRADILTTLGEVSGQLGRLSAAEQYLQTAITERQRLFGNSVPTLRSWLALGRVYQGEGMNNNAILAYREAIAIAGTVPRQTAILKDEDLLPFAQAVYDQSQSIADPGPRQGLLNELFTAFQLSGSQDRDRTTGLAADQLVKASPALAKLLVQISALQSQDAQLRAALIEEQSLPLRLRTAGKAEALTSQGAEITRTLSAAQGSLARDFGDYAALVKPKLHQLDDVRARLTPDEAVAMFIIGRKSSFVQLVTRDGLTLAPIAAGEAALVEAVRGIRRGLEIEGQSVGDFDLKASHQLFQTLFGNALVPLKASRRLTVIQVGALAPLPFAVLVEQDPVEDDYRKAHWLVRDRMIGNAPSLARFMLLRTTRTLAPAPRSFLAVANPKLEGKLTATAMMGRAFTGCRGDEPVDSALLRSLAPLPETESEVRAIAKAINATDETFLLGEAATEAGLRQTQLSDYRMLYFATHGLVPGELQCQNQPGLVLTPPVQRDAPRQTDGLLDASEIAALELRADLVVLSACNTAAPQARRLGSGALSGLAEAFFHAGARSVLASHWQVPSAATETLMRHTFTAMGERREMAIDEALRIGQLAALTDRRTAHPFFWAAFIVLGDGAGQPLNDGTGQPLSAGGAGAAK